MESCPDVGRDFAQRAVALHSGREGFFPSGWTVDGVPGLVTMGEYEWAESRAKEGAAQKAKHPQLPLTMVAEPAAGHFASTRAKIDIIGLYLRKALAARLPPKVASGGIVTLRPIDTAVTGWLYEPWRKNKPPSFAPGPVGGTSPYQGDRAHAFWAFDQELAEAIRALGDRYRARSVQLLGYVQAGKVVPQVNGTHQQVTLSWLPEEDGISFRLHGDFLDSVPPGRPEKWTGLLAGSPIGHAAKPSDIVIERICGPVRSKGPDRFCLAFGREGMDNPYRSNEIWFVARHPGDALYQPAEQQAVMRLPLRNTEGADQRIEFPAIADRLSDASPFELKATSNSGLPVGYYVLAGPAEVDGDVLRLTALPPRATMPMKVTVVAWQWGRSTEPKLKTAEPVTRSFWIRR